MALRPFIERSHVAIWKWVQKMPSRRRISVFLVDESWVGVGGLNVWMWVAYESPQRQTLGFWISWTRNAMQAYLFLRSLWRLIVGAWRGPTAHHCTLRRARYSGLRHRRYRFEEWLHAVIERGIQRLKEHTRIFDHHYPYRRRWIEMA